MMREGESRRILYAALASIVVHAALLLILPLPGDAQQRQAKRSHPIVARLLEAPATEPVARVALVLRDEPAKLPSPQLMLKRAQPARKGPVAPTPSQAVANAVPALQQAPSPPEALDAGTVAQYRIAIISAARRFNDYPSTAYENKWQGKVEIRLVMGAGGELSALHVRNSAGHAVLDRHAIEMIERAQAMVPMPSALRGKEVALDIPVVFTLREPGA